MELGKRRKDFFLFFSSIYIKFSPRSKGKSLTTQAREKFFLEKFGGGGWYDLWENIYPCSKIFLTFAYIKNHDIHQGEKDQEKLDLLNLIIKWLFDHCFVNVFISYIIQLSYDGGGALCANYRSIDKFVKNAHYMGLSSQPPHQNSAYSYYFFQKIGGHFHPPPLTMNLYSKTFYILNFYDFFLHCKICPLLGIYRRVKGFGLGERFLVKKINEKKTGAHKPPPPHHN